MRTIKFRAWDKKEMKMIHSVGLLPLQAVIIPNGEKKVGDMGAYQKMYVFKEPEGFETMQFTGLLDKNGKEIYEGDIVRDESGLLEIVKYGVQEVDAFMGVGFNLWPFQTYPNNSSEELNKTFEVVGNVFENPELLTS